MKEDEPFDPVDIRLLRSYAVMTDPNRGSDLVEQFRFLVVWSVIVV